MTMENEALVSYRDYPAQRRTLEGILQKLSEQDLPGAPYVEQYLRHMHRRDLTANTLRAAFTSLQGFLTFLKNQGKPDLLAVVHNDLEAFVECLQERGLKPVSVENNLRQVKTFLRYLVEGKVVPAEVLSRRISIKVPKPLPRAMDPLDVKRLLAVVQKVRDRAMILVLLRTGIRIGELLNLRVSDVYLPERKIHLVVGEKNRTGRVVYLSVDACQALQEWIRKREKEKPLLFYGQGRSSLMLYRRPGDVSAVSAEGRDIREELFVAWSEAYLCYGAVECGDADRVFAAGVRAQQPGADPALCPVDG